MFGREGDQDLGGAFRTGHLPTSYGRPSLEPLAASAEPSDERQVLFRGRDAQHRAAVRTLDILPGVFVGQSHAPSADADELNGHAAQPPPIRFPNYAPGSGVKRRNCSDRAGPSQIVIRRTVEKLLDSGNSTV